MPVLTSSPLASRCYAKATGQAFAAKRLCAAQAVTHPYLLDNELHNLRRANQRNIPRVVELVELVGCLKGEAVLVME